MGCYIVPAGAALAHYGLRKKFGWNSEHHERLNLLLLGGATFGVVDHAWNKELLPRGEGLLSDLLLGFAITAAILLVWGAMGLARRAGAPARGEGAR